MPVLLAGALAAGCATANRVSAPPLSPGLQPTSAGTEEGLASWYGEPYHGRLTASGERYDMHEMTAAHRTLPFGTRVRVTNLSNGRRTEVLVTDRGPFVEGRIIDLSHAAAKALGAVEAGVVPVRLEVVHVGDGMTGERCWEVQVGAFARQASVARAQAVLEQGGYSVRLAPAGGGLTRVRVTSLGGREQAVRTASDLQRDFAGALAVPCGGPS